MQMYYFFSVRPLESDKPHLNSVIEKEIEVMTKEYDNDWSVRMSLLIWCVCPLNSEVVENVTSAWRLSRPTSCHKPKYIFYSKHLKEARIWGFEL